MRRLLGPLLLLGLLPAACASPPPPPPQGPSPEEIAVRRAADVALTTLSRRKYSIAGCDAAAARLAEEAEAKAAPKGAECTLFVVKQRDRTWLVVVRSATQPGAPQALVTVSPGGEGAQHIDYVY